MSRRTIDPELAARAAARMRDRDLLIYEQVRGWNLRQADVARKFGLTQARVSQIVRDVSRRMAAAAPPASDSAPARAWSQSTEPPHERMPTPIMPERTPMTASDRKAMNKQRQKRLQAIKRRR